jgi:predicted site-specific integrase-resolvase
MSSDPVLITGPRVAEMLGVKPEAVRAWVKSGKLKPIVLPSGSHRYRLEDIQKILQGAGDVS